MSSDGGLDVRAPVPPGLDCPKVTAGKDVASVRVRAEPDPDFPVRVCSARVPAAARDIVAGGLPAPSLPGAIKRIVVIGDTGCRLKGIFVQDCNVPSAWPFANIARLAALRRPDLVIHVGDYLYRETACPDGNPGCSGSPFGDNWAVWKRDFFDPAAPLLAAAPWVLVRGNHEICGRGGHGWFRLLDPHPEVLDCPEPSEPYALRLPALHLLVMDSANADDHQLDPGKVAVYRRQFQELLAEARSPAWLLTHRPVWALTQGEDVPQGPTLNITEQAAIRGLIPPAVELVVSGHVHDFTAYSFGPKRPAQLVVGSGGDRRDAILQTIAPGVVIDGMKAARASGLPDHGYLVLDRVGTGWDGTMYSAADSVLARCTFRGRDLACRMIGGKG
jgi:Calcineurin-like phosphoesterase